MYCIYIYICVEREREIERERERERYIHTSMYVYIIVEGVWLHGSPKLGGRRFSGRRFPRRCCPQKICDLLLYYNPLECKISNRLRLLATDATEHAEQNPTLFQSAV